MRSGRRVKEKQEPLKWVKQRAVTLNKRRQQELARQEGEDVLQGLYAEWQTEVYRPPPIKDVSKTSRYVNADQGQGIVPQNSFGNIDLYAPTMLPKGAVHLPYKGIAKVAKAMGISYAEACVSVARPGRHLVLTAQTGFEFKKQRAIPVITGIVVAEENETAVMEVCPLSLNPLTRARRTRRPRPRLKSRNGLEWKIALLSDGPSLSMVSVSDDVCKQSTERERVCTCSSSTRSRSRRNRPRGGSGKPAERLQA
jgi:xeroderma pigmentosum group C-complementing protein